jgi:hypothetical protein
MSSMPIEGELTRHHDQPFYAQKQAPKFFWGGCLIPIALVATAGYFILKGVAAVNGLEVARLFILVVILLAFGQLIFGGTIFAKTRSSLGKGLLLGACMLLLLLLLALIGAASALSGFLH